MWYDVLKGMAKIYGKQVENDKMTLDEVPVRWQDKVRAAYEAGYPLILLQENGLTALSKPHGKAFEACSRGQMLILAPWQHHNEHLVIQRSQCLQLNDMAHDLSTY